jgi:hypothetical protein
VQPSSLVFVAIVAGWAAYLLPQWLHRRDALGESRGADRHSSGLRVLSRRPRAASGPSTVPLLTPPHGVRLFLDGDLPAEIYLPKRGTGAPDGDLAQESAPPVADAEADGDTAEYLPAERPAAEPAAKPAAPTSAAPAAAPPARAAAHAGRPVRDASGAAGEPVSGRRPQRRPAAAPAPLTAPPRSAPRRPAPPRTASTVAARSAARARVTATVTTSASGRVAARRRTAVLLALLLLTTVSWAGQLAGFPPMTVALVVTALLGLDVLALRSAARQRKRAEATRSAARAEQARRRRERDLQRARAAARLRERPAADDPTIELPAVREPIVAGASGAAGAPRTTAPGCRCPCRRPRTHSSRWRRVRSRRLSRCPERRLPATPTMTRTATRRPA